MAEHSSYYYLPHVGIEQQPSAPFHWKDNFEKQCNAAAHKCLGFDSGGNVFDAKIMTPGGAKLSIHKSPDYGTFLKDEIAFKSMCKLASGTPSGRRCQVTPEQAQAAIHKLVQEKKVETFDPVIRRGYHRLRAHTMAHMNAARRVAQHVDIIKLILVIVFFVWILNMSKKA